MKTVRLGCTDIGAILFAGIDDDSLVFNKYATTIEVYQNANLNIIILVNE